ncbi:type II toxin-antitoxin system VapC family toxin [Nostoc sp. CHAB 5844]|nr:type II toxin-antitoxin system VapC family toxin [Nostoc sp. CHAB 5844]
MDTSVAVRFLNADEVVVAQVLALKTVILPTVVVGELLFGAENSSRSLQNLPRYLEFIETCEVVKLGRETALVYARTRLALKQKGRSIPMNDVWIAAQCLEHGWRLITDDSDFCYVDGLMLEN